MIPDYNIDGGESDLKFFLLIGVGLFFLFFVFCLTTLHSVWLQTGFGESYERFRHGK